jgi:hypothetical protein
VLFGESLGSYGTETTFGDLESMAAGADGTLLVGPPFANPIWRELVDERDTRNPLCGTWSTTTARRSCSFKTLPNCGHRGTRGKSPM